MQAFDNLKSLIHFENTIFFNNSAKSFLFSLSNSQMLMNNVTFSKNNNNIFSLTNSILLFENSSIEKQFCSTSEYGCFLNGAQNSHANVLNCKIFEITSYVEGNIYVEDSHLLLSNSILSNLSSIKYLGICMFAVNSLVYVNYTSFLNYDFNCISLKNGQFFMNDSLFFNEKPFQLKSNYKNNYGSIRCTFCHSFIINKITFENNAFVQYGGAIALYELSSQNSSENENDFIINKSNFFNNTVFENGGAIFIYNSRIIIQECVFHNNAAKNGGAIYCDSSKSLEKMLITNNDFVNNSVSIEGGAIKWTNVMPNISKNVFLNNKAFYGNDIASFPIRMKVYINTQNSSFSFSDLGKYDLPLIKNVPSGNVFPYNFTINIVDCYDQVVSTIRSNKQFIIVFYNKISILFFIEKLA